MHPDDAGVYYFHGYSRNLEPWASDTEKARVRKIDEESFREIAWFIANDPRYPGYGRKLIDKSGLELVAFPKKPY